MGNIISKMGLYDLFARGVTGVVVLCAADLFGIANILDSEIPVWAMLLCGYFLGLVLEELSYLQESMFHSRDRIEQTVRNSDKYRNYDFEKCKAALMADNHELVCDEPLAHVIMSASFRIAFFALLLIEIADAVCCCKLITEHCFSPVLDIVILEALIIVFHCRVNHYIKHRTEKIFDFCIEKNYAEIEKEEKSKCQKNNE